MPLAWVPGLAVQVEASPMGTRAGSSVPVSPGRLLVMVLAAV